MSFFLNGGNGGKRVEEKGKRVLLLLCGGPPGLPMGFGCLNVGFELPEVFLYLFPLYTWMEGGGRRLSNPL